MHALRGFPWLSERAKQRTKNQSGVIVMETRALDTSQPPLFGRLSSEAQRLGSPFRGDVCLFFCPRTVNMLCFQVVL